MAISYLEERIRREFAFKLEIDRKLKDLKDKYGDTIPKEQIDPVMRERVDILYRLDGNSQGLQDNEVPDEEAGADE